MREHWTSSSFTSSQLSLAKESRSSRRVTAVLNYRFYQLTPIAMGLCGCITVWRIPSAEDDAVSTTSRERGSAQLVRVGWCSCAPPRAREVVLTASKCLSKDSPQLRRPEL